MTQLSLIWDRMEPDNVERALKLTGDLKSVYRVLSDGRPHLVADISKICNIPENSAQSQCRHLRRAKWGSMNVQCKNLGNGLNYYILLPGLYERKSKKKKD